MMMSLSAARRRISVMKQRSNCWHSRADAAIGARVQLGPQMAVLGQLGQLGAVAGLGRLLPIADDAEVVDLLQPVQHRLVGEVVELLAAQIIAAALHVADAQLAQVLPQEGNVLEEELLLQGLGAGGDDDALAGANDRQQVRQRLAGAGAGLDDQVAALLSAPARRPRPSASCPRRNSYAGWVRASTPPGPKNWYSDGKRAASAADCDVEDTARGACPYNSC